MEIASLGNAKRVSNCNFVETDLTETKFDPFFKFEYKYNKFRRGRVFGLVVGTYLMRMNLLFHFYTDI